MILLTILSLVAPLISALNNISLANNQSFQFLVPASSVFELNIRPSQFEFLLVQLDSCRLGLIQVNTSAPLSPTNQYQFSNVYSIGKEAAKVVINYTSESTSSYVTVYGFNDYSKLPTNSRWINASWSDQELNISFASINIYGTVVECNYTVQFHVHPAQYNCRQNTTDRSIGEIVIPSHISNNLTNFTLIVPLHVRYARDAPIQYAFNRLDKIQELLNSGVTFEVQVYAKITKPMVLDVSYRKVLVQPQKTLQALKSGFLIVVIGMAVYALVSCGYLYFKRKYKNPEYFHEEPESHPQLGYGNHPSAGTIEQMRNNPK